jgi:hypothetical protein
VEILRKVYLNGASEKIKRPETTLNVMAASGRIEYDYNLKTKELINAKYELRHVEALIL